MNEPQLNGKPTLPRSWEWVPLAQIASINPPLDRCVLNDAQVVNFVPMRAVEPEGGGLTQPETRLYGEVKKGYTAFLSGDVIMAKITPCMENGKTTVVPDLPGSVCFGSTEFYNVRPEHGIDARWLAYFLLQHTVRQEAQRQMGGAVGQMRVPASFLNHLIVPCPPTSEQIRLLDTIDELLSDLDAGIAALERVQAKLSLYRAAVLKAAVQGDLTAEWRERNPTVESAAELLKRILNERRRAWEEAELRKFKDAGREPPKNWKAKYVEPVGPDTAVLPQLPDGWCWATVEQCSALIQYGTSSKTNGDANGIPVLRMGNIRTDGSLQLDELKYLPVAHGEFPQLLLSPDDLLFNRTNSAELVGKTGHYRGIPSPCSFASYLIRVRMRAGVYPAIIAYSLNSLMGRSWIKSVVTQVVGQANVNGSKLASFAFPLSPEREQASIVDTVEDQLSIIDHLEADLAAKLKSSQSLRQSILRDAFAGQLLPQDPNDEPASALLSRIAAEREERAQLSRAPKKPKKPTGQSRKTATPATTRKKRANGYFPNW